MALGKLLIQLADGSVEEHVLTGQTTSIGRQPGNDIVLATSAVSRYHAQIIVSQGQVFVVDLETVNGTFVNDQLVAPDTPIPLNTGDEIVVGDVRVIFVAEAEMDSRTTALTPEAIPVEGEAPFQMVLDEPHQSVAPGARLHLMLGIENPTDQLERYTVSISGMEPEWTKLDRHEVHLAPGEQTEVTISIQPPRSSNTHPGLYPLVVRVALRDDPAQFLETSREIDVVGYNGLGMIVREGKQPGTYLIAVQNQGNVPAGIRLGGYHPDRKLNFGFDHVELYLDPGQTNQVMLTVRPRGRSLDQIEKTKFAVVARSLDAANYQAPVAAYYTISPMWPTLAAGATLPLLGGALVILTVAALALVLRPAFIFGGEVATALPTPTVASVETQSPVTLTPAPIQTVLPATPTVAEPIVEVLAFDVAPQSLWQNQVATLTLSWQVTGATSVQITGPDGAVVYTGADLTSSLPVETSVESDDVFFTLVATDSNGNTSVVQRTLTVRPLVCTIGPGGVTVSSEPGTFTLPGEQLPAGTLVQITGQHIDRDWLRIADEVGITLGWVQRSAGVVLCTDEGVDVNLDGIDFVTISSPGVTQQAPPPTSTLTPEPEETEKPPQ